MKELEAHKDTETDIDETISFFEGLSTCMCAELCDYDSTIMLFGRDADDLWGMNYPFVDS